MAVTKQDAISADRFHENHEPAGKIFEWRGNGACKTWVTRPEEFSRPVKYGLRSYGYITQSNAHQFHRADQCPTRHVRVTMPDGVTFWGIMLTDPAPVAAEHSPVVAVQVTRRETSKHRVGSRVNVPTDAIKDL